MAKYTLICDHEDGSLKTTCEFEAITLTEVLENMDIFLKGSGFTWIQGQLDIVEEQ